jgi:hypothetical protein
MKLHLHNGGDGSATTEAYRPSPVRLTLQQRRGTRPSKIFVLPTPDPSATVRPQHAATWTRRFEAGRAPAPSSPAKQPKRWPITIHPCSPGCQDRVMSGRASKRGFAARPGDVESWIKASDAPPPRMDDGAAFTARLTIDVTPGLAAASRSPHSSAESSRLIGRLIACPLL